MKQYRPGRVFKLNNTSRTGEVLEVIRDIHLINWEGDTPFFIRIKMHDNGAEYLTNPSMIRGQ